MSNSAIKMQQTNLILACKNARKYGLNVENRMQIANSANALERMLRVHSSFNISKLPGHTIIREARELLKTTTKIPIKKMTIFQKLREILSE